MQKLIGLFLVLGVLVTFSIAGILTEALTMTGDIDMSDNDIQNIGQMGAGPSNIVTFTGVVYGSNCVLYTVGAPPQTVTNVIFLAQ